MRPRVSIVTATYHRSAVLALALDTVRRQTLADWELIVVGDACTDDTEAVVTGLADDRVRWVNLHRNCGEQSGPNNHGVALAEGELIAFLNHDDLWFADHLERCVATLDATGADLAFAFGASLEPDGRVTAVAAAPDGPFEPHMSVPASLWVLRRELAQRIGPWAPGSECWAAPSQHWLQRAHWAGARIVQSPALTTAVLRSGGRPNSYRTTGAPGEHVRAHAAVTGDPGYRAELATAIAIANAARVEAPRGPVAHARLAARDAFLGAARRTRTDPAEVIARLRYRRRGGYIEHLRVTRGLVDR
jgi:glycosyltransferase involved in cell wall biosynthesis